VGTFGIFVKKVGIWQKSRKYAKVGLISSMYNKSLTMALIFDLK
jgi:hypothetical protein